MVRLTATQLYSLGYFNACTIVRQPDGTSVYFCDGELAPCPYHFHMSQPVAGKRDVLYESGVMEEVKHA